MNNLKYLLVILLILFPAFVIASSLPDLVVQKPLPFPKGHLLKDKIIQFSGIGIINQGTAAASNVVVTFECNDGKVIDNTIASINPNSIEYTTFNVQWSQIGQKKCSVIVDKKNRIPETNNRNNIEKFKPFTIIKPKAELVIRKATVHNSIVYAHSPVKIDFEIANNGFADAPENRLHIKCNDRKQHSLTIIPLRANMLYRVSTNMTFNSYGQKKCIATIDKADVVNESDESNNSVKLQGITILDSRPDLQFTEGKSVSYEGKVGVPVQLYSLDLVNSGKEDAVNFIIRLVCSEIPPQEQVVPIVPANYKQKFSFSPSWTNPGVKRCKVIADANNNIDEKDEQNNKAKYSPITIK